MEFIKSVYRDLGNPNLLKRCLNVATQNLNESLHSKVWIKRQKVKFYGLSRVTLLVQHTALDHNFGYTEGSIIMYLLGTEAKLQEYLQWLDKERVRLASPKKPKKKPKEEIDESYQPGEV